MDRGRPPVLIVGIGTVPAALAAEATQAGLPAASVCRLLSTDGDADALAAAAEPPAGDGPFWELIRRALRLAGGGRDFPPPGEEEEEEKDVVSPPGGVRSGAAVRVVRGAGGSGPAECGTCIGRAPRTQGGQGQQLYRVRLWDGDVVAVPQHKLTVISFKLGVASPARITRMDTTLVRLRGLSAKPELNGKEGETDDEVASNGRLRVTLKDKTTVAVKPDNAEIVEAARPELEGRVGLVDALDPALARYKVLLVQTNNWTEERSRVRLRDLSTREDLNGQEASIVSFNPQNSRYTALCGDGCEIAIKRANFEFLDPLRIEAEILSFRPECVDYFLDPDEEGKLFEL